MWTRHVTKIQLHEKFCVHAKKRLTLSVKLTDPWSVRLLKTIELYMSPLKESTLWWSSGFQNMIPRPAALLYCITWEPLRNPTYWTQLHTCWLGISGNQVQQSMFLPRRYCRLEFGKPCGKATLDCSVSYNDHLVALLVRVGWLMKEVGGHNTELMLLSSSYVEDKCFICCFKKKKKRSF